MNKTNTEKITNTQFNNIIDHTESERKYFNIQNNDIIYNRLKNETNIVHLPNLGPCVNFGLGDICLEEDKNIFKFYVIDRKSKFDYAEFSDIKDAIKRLVSFYKENDEIDDEEVMTKIFFETLNLDQKIKKLK